VGKHESNLAAIERAIDEALDLGADLIVLPELCTSGYQFVSDEEVAEAALTLDSTVLSGWQSRLRGSGAVLAAGIPLRDESAVYNAAVLLDEGGLLSVYRKVHLWDQEKRWFTSGDEAPPVVETQHGRIGVLVCYDLEFPEMSRGLLLNGAEVLVVPTNWPVATTPEGERPAELHDAMSSARLSRLIIACCDRCGVERDTEFAGGSAIIGADGWLRAERLGRGVGPVVADVDVAEARDKVLTLSNHTLDDRRPDVYDQLGRMR